MQTREEKLPTWGDPSNEKLTGLRVLEGCLSPKSSDPGKRQRISDYKIGHDQIAEILLDTSCDDGSNAAPPYQWQFKVISFPRLRDGRFALSFPKPVFQMIQEAWHLHPSTIEVFLSNNGVLSPFLSSDGERTSLLLKVPNSRSTGFDCVSVTCDPPHRTTYVLYHHLQDESSVFETLLATPEYCYDPHFFLAAVYRSHHQQIETGRNRIDDAVHEIERQTGFGPPGRLMRQRRPSLDASQSATDPKGVIRQLSYCQTDLAIIANVARCCLACGNWLVQAIDDTDRSDPVPPPELKAARKLVRQEVEYLRRRTETLLSQVQALKDRAHSQTNFMLNSIAQSDAEYTAAIAMDGKRDGIAMKTISILGVVFLPGTFMATLFSVGMFDWGSADGGGSSSLRVSPSMWIYWAATLPLTAVTILIWILWSWREMSQSKKRLMVNRIFAPMESGNATASTGPRLFLTDKIV